MKNKLFLKAAAAVISISLLNTTIVSAKQVDYRKTDDTKQIIQKQIEEFNKLDKTVKPDKNQKEIKPIHSTIQRLSEGVAGNYPTRKGVILVTSDGTFGKLVGHAGIIYTKEKTVESMSDGVGIYSNDWDTRYEKVYGATVHGTTVKQDASAADDAYSYLGRPYNFNFFNTLTTDKFYCSQLVYRAYLDTTNIDLNYGGGIVFPYDLIKTDKTYTIYTQGV